MEPWLLCPLRERTLTWEHSCISVCSIVGDSPWFWVLAFLRLPSPCFCCMPSPPCPDPLPDDVIIHLSSDLDSCVWHICRFLVTIPRQTLLWRSPLWVLVHPTDGFSLFFLIPKLLCSLSGFLSAFLCWWLLAQRAWGDGSVSLSPKQEALNLIRSPRVKTLGREAYARMWEVN